MYGERSSVMKRAGIIIAACLLVSGCGTPQHILKSMAGTATYELDAHRKAAYMKVLNYDYKTCYKNTEELLNKMKNVKIYAKDAEMIAIFFTAVNTTPVGIYFKAIDPERTRVEVSSPSRAAKEWIARNVFAGRVLE